MYVLLQALQQQASTLHHGDYNTSSELRRKGVLQVSCNVCLAYLTFNNILMLISNAAFSDYRCMSLKSSEGLALTTDTHY